MTECVHEWVEQPDRGHYSVHCRLCQRCAPSQMQLLSALAARDAEVEEWKAACDARGEGHAHLSADFYDAIDERDAALAEVGRIKERADAWRAFGEASIRYSANPVGNTSAVNAMVSARARLTELGEILP